MNKKVSKRPNKALSLAVVTATAVGGSGVFVGMPHVAQAAESSSASNEVKALGDSVTLKGPSGSKEYTDKITDKLWFSKAGKFTVNVDSKKYSGVTVSVDGKNVTENADSSKVVSFDVKEKSSVKVTVGTLDDENEKLSNTKSTTFKIGVDDADPEVTGKYAGIKTVDGKSEIQDDAKLYFKEDKSDSGIASRELQKSVADGWVTVSDKDTYKLEKDGKYRVLVKNNVGTEKALSLDDVFGIPSTAVKKQEKKVPKKVDTQPAEKPKKSKSPSVSPEPSPTKTKDEEKSPSPSKSPVENRVPKADDVKPQADANSSMDVNDKPLSDKWYTGLVDGDERKDLKVVITVKKAGIGGGDEYDDPKIYLNGQEVDYKTTEKEEDFVYEFNLKDHDLSTDGMNQIRFAIAPTRFDDYDIKVDRENPEVTANLEGDYVVDDGVIYAYGDAYITGTASDEPSGVNTIVVLRENEDGEDEKQEVVRNGDDYRVKLKEGKNFRVKVSDLAGNYIDKSFSELNLGGKDIVYDNKPPEIKRLDKGKPAYQDDDGRDWYKDPFTMEYEVKDANLKRVTSTVNGEEKNHKLSDDDKYKINLANYDAARGVRYDVNLYALDKATNDSEVDRTVYVDSDAPKDIKADVEGDYEDRPFGVFSQEPLILKANASDGYGVGVKGYRLKDAEGKVVEDSESGNIKIPNGSFTLTAYDYLDNESDPITLKELLGTETNKFYTDGENPELKLSKDKSDYDDWYKDDVEFDAKFTDNLALYSGTATINGREVASFTSDKIETSRSLSFNTKGIDADSNGAYNVVVQGEDAAGNEVKKKETVRIDRDKPEISKFVFTEPGYKEGDGITKSDDYGYFFKGATSVDVKVTDKAPSSGLKEIRYTLRNGSGSVKSTGTQKINGGNARVQIPNGFKGYIEAKPVDNVDNVGDMKKPSGIVTEDRNWYVNTTELEINVPDPGHRDDKDQELYDGDTVATVPIKQGVSGIRKIEWGIDDTTIGTADVSPDGTIRGSNYTIQERDKNLILRVKGDLPIKGNNNDMKIWINVQDRVGYKSDTDKTVSIDKDKPIIDVDYNKTNDSTYYNADRVATITIRERNFDKGAVKLSGEHGSLGSWTRNGDVWTATMTFSEEKEYKWGIDYTDMAGNVGEGYKSESFTIDKTNPDLDVKFDNNDVKNGKYYSKGRTAHITVKDRNFDPKGVKYTGDGSLSGWSSNGDTHTASASFNDDGEYKFGIDVTDKADNKSEHYDSDNFIVDASDPKIKIEGVKNGVSYKKDVGVTVKVGDKYIDASASSVNLVGREGGKRKLDGGFDSKNGTFTIKNFPKKRAFDDLYHLEAEVKDRSGNTKKEKVSFSVNRFGSRFNFLNEEFDGKYFQELPKDVELHQESVDRLDMNGFSATVIKNGEELEVPRDKFSVKESGGKDSKWKYDLTVNKEFYDEDGGYQTQMFSKAKDGTKESSMDQEYSFVIDSTPPEILISGVEDGKIYTALEKKASVEVRDLAGVDEIDISVNGRSLKYKENDGVYTVDLPVNSTYQDIKVEVRDKAGNMNQEEILGYYLTSSKWEAFLQNKWVQAIIALLFMTVGGLLFLVGKRTTDKINESSKTADARQKAQMASALGTSGSVGFGDDAGDATDRPTYSPVVGVPTEEFDSVSNEDAIPTDISDEDDETTSYFDGNEDGTDDLGEEGR